MSPARFESVVPTSEWPQTYAVDRAATVIALIYWTKIFICKVKQNAFSCKQESWSKGNFEETK